MSRILFVILWSGIMILLELLVQALGLFVPFLACFIFYLSRNFPIRYALAVAVLGISVLDFCLGSAPVSVFPAILIALFGSSWIKQFKGQYFILHILPGALIPVLFYLPRILLHCSYSGLPAFTLHLLLSALFTAIILPVLFSIFHFFAKQAALEINTKPGR